jgi:RNA-binding protein Musashi
MKEASSISRILSEDQNLDGKRVDCKPAVPRDQAAGEEVPAPVVNFRTRKMFVGGLPPDVTEAEFSNFFSQFGAIEDNVIMYDRETGRPRGFGFITFISDEAVEHVLENYDSNFIRGKWVECKKATPRDCGGMMGGGMMGGGMMGGGMMGAGMMGQGMMGQGMMGGKMMFQPYMQPMMNPYMGSQYYDYNEPHPHSIPEVINVVYPSDQEADSLQRDEEMRRRLFDFLLVTPESSSIAAVPE